MEYNGAGCGTKIKICGIRREEDIEAANRCMPDYIGFILSNGYRRSVETAIARRLAQQLDPRIRAVGVFVNEPVSVILEAADFLDLIQLHGDEDNDYLARLRERTDKPLIRAFRIRNASDLEKAQKSSADYLLLDNGTGTGEAFDWSLIPMIDRPWILAGGLGPENIGSAVNRLGPFAVDLSSGAETDGRKDPEKMELCVRAVRKTYKTAQ